MLWAPIAPRPGPAYVAVVHHAGRTSVWAGLPDVMKSFAPGTSSALLDAATHCTLGGAPTVPRLPVSTPIAQLLTHSPCPVLRVPVARHRSMSCATVPSPEM